MHSESDKTASNPKTIEEAVKFLVSIVKSEDSEWIKSSSKKEVGARCHHGIGRWIRNNWGLWTQDSDLYKYLTKLGFEHADDMSAIIIDCLWCELNGKPWTIEEELKRFQEHWNKIKAED